MLSGRLARSSIVLVVSVLALVPKAHADDVAASDIAAARALAIEGIRLAEAHQCADAVDKLARAERLYHAPTTLERLAECQIELGQVVAGTESLQRILREPLGPKPPPAFVFARARAERALAAALPKIGRLRIESTSPRGQRVTVTLDGEPVSAALFGIERPTDPGEHVIAATAQGFANFETRVTIGPGETRTVAIVLTPATVDGAAPTPVPLPPPPPPETGAPAPTAPSRTGSYVAFGLGVAGLAAAGGIGAVYFSQKDERDAQCSAGVCAVGAPTEDDIATLKAASIGAIVLGGTSLLVGVVLYAMGGGHVPTTAKAAPAIVRF